MNERALLDTSTVIALFQEERAFNVSSFDRVAVSSLTYAELRLKVDALACGLTQALDHVPASWGQLCLSVRDNAHG